MKILDRCGRFLSGIVYQNIAVLIAVGFLRILFSPAGWIPNPELYDIVNPMMTYLVPILFAYTGGRMLGDTRGGVIAAFVTIMAVIGSDREYPLILPALLIGPFVGWFIKKVDTWMEDRIPVGFELLFHNAVSGAIGVIFGLFSYLCLVPMMTIFIHAALHGTEVLIRSGMLPILAFVIEPAKVLFFNNVMNHGILEPLGMNQLKSAHTSIFFILEANPGPGFGMLLATYLWSRDKKRGELKTAITIQLLGGIHEVYFPYVLMKPMLIFPLIMGGLTGNLIFYLLDTGLVATPSPGSLLVIMAMTPKSGYAGVLCGIAAAAAVSFSISYIMLRLLKKGDVKDEPGRERTRPDEGGGETDERSGNGIDKERTIAKIVFACDGGMASSAMGAAKLKKALKAKKIEHIQVIYTGIDRIPKDADLVVVHQQLKKRMKQSLAEANYLFVPSLIDSELYQHILKLIESSRPVPRAKEPETGAKLQQADRLPLRKEQFLLDLRVKDKWEAIEIAGRRMIDLGMAKDEEYIQEMKNRESMHSTWIGSGIAVPHGLDPDSDSIVQPGWVMIRFAEETMFGEDERVRLMFAICGKGNEQLDLISKLAFLVERPEIRKALLTMRTQEQFVLLFNALRSE
ncbi:PTS sugar transporter subunit IIA [Paenibacillus sp. MSJ-34]|uniref:PTS sugar transporter subunit IIA n=1 Tax=Paenibacillus sp. MSJ-34 TaxID=2841529 RepID=UPI001C1041A4|nr:PTS sugar transporter subunit IIA [Paenibacillus sp. MSJ-34]MBU5444639.1 PTS sugar transporter subunit IIA [Paenibacillus sp. MSJ-34]